MISHKLAKQLKEAGYPDDKVLVLSTHDAMRIYEWRLALKQGMNESCCEYCDDIEKMIKKFIGLKESLHLKKQVKKHPYFIRGMRSK